MVFLLKPSFLNILNVSPSDGEGCHVSFLTSTHSHEYFPEMTVTVIDSSKATSGPVAVAPSRMEEDVHILVLVPFRDIVEKANLAIQNADDADPPHAEMRKAAQTLVKEGERALKKIQPICKKHLDEYGQNFVNALKENGMTETLCVVEFGR